MESIGRGTIVDVGIMIVIAARSGVVDAVPNVRLARRLVVGIVGRRIDSKVEGNYGVASLVVGLDKGWR